MMRPPTRKGKLPTREAANHPGHEIRLDRKYDAYWCVECNERIERECSDPDCEYCAWRPASPTQDMQQYVLEYMQWCMWTSPDVIGRRVVERFGIHRNGSNYKAVGAGLLGSMKRRGLVVFLPDVKGWRITPRGRGAITPTLGTAA